MHTLLGRKLKQKRAASGVKRVAGRDQHRKVDEIVPRKSIKRWKKGLLVYVRTESEQRARPVWHYFT